jgi:hypothetical protein
MAVVSRATFASTLATKVNDNTAGEVSAQDVREMLTDLEDSVIWNDEVANYLETADLGVTVQAYDADTLKADTTDELTVGYSTAAYSLGTISSGTVTPEFANGNLQTLNNNGAFTLAPPSTGSGTMVIQVVNDASAGTITTSGFSSVTGDVFTTVSGAHFLLSIAKVGTRTYLSILAASDN